MVIQQGIGVEQKVVSRQPSERDAEQVDVARRAWRRYGKGHHAAALNFGDCFSYALAVTRGEPLPFKGADFAKTDVNRPGGTSPG